MGKVGRPRLYQGGRIKTTTEFSEELDNALVQLAQKAGKSKAAYMEEVLRQVPEVAAQVEWQRQQKEIDAMIAEKGAIILQERKRANGKFSSSD